MDTEIIPMQKLYLLLLLIFCFGCGTSNEKTAQKNDESFASCKYGSPKPIFSATTPLVSSHDFKLGKQTAVETVFFDADIKLELTQSGCEKPKQEFKFTIPGDSKVYTTEDWIDMALQQLDFLGNLHKPLEPLLFWSGALKMQKEEIKLGKPVTLEQGHYVKIDRMAGDKEGILMIELSQF